MSSFSSIAVATIVCATSAFAMPTGQMEMSISSMSPAAGDTVTISVDTRSAESGKRVMLMWGGKPGPTGSLSNPRRLAIGRTDATGTYSMAFPVPAGLVGNTFYFQAFALVDGKAKQSTTAALTVTPAADDADWVLTPSSFQNVATGHVTSHANPIEQAYRRSSPGDLILLENGSYSRFTLDLPCDDADAPKRWIKARNRATIRRHTVGGSATIAIKNAACNVAMVNLDIKASDLYGVSFNNNTSGYTGIEFHDCTIDGGWDHYSGTGTASKWGVLSWELGDFVWRGGWIRNIQKEHAFYLHNSQGDITIENMEIEHVGRTAVQMTARASESSGLPGKGFVSIRNVTATDPNLRDFFGGGSAFTFAGRNSHHILLDNVTYRAGFDADLNARNGGRPVGTGGFVAYYGGGSLNMNNGPILIRNSSLVMAPGTGDRDHIQVAATDGFALQSSEITSGFTRGRDALRIDALTVGALSLDRRSQVTGETTYAGTTYPTYAEMLDALDCDPVCN